MNLTSFVDVDVKREESMREFLDFNALSHETINNTLLSQGIVTEHYPLWTMAGADRDWALVHAQEHRAIANVLGLSLPVGLDFVDFNRQESANSWFENHALAHQDIDNALGL
jgi:hypothetical protein